MKALIVAICLCVGVADAAHANPGKCQSLTNPKCFLGAPAPEIGSSVPALLAVGGVMLGAMFLRHRRKA
jgi:hypothetical protein